MERGALKLLSAVLCVNKFFGCRYVSGNENAKKGPEAGRGGKLASTERLPPEKLSLV